MSIILRLQNLPWSANSLDIRRYFQGLSIPEGGVHIVGGEKGDAFIAFTTDEDARQGMERDGGKVKESKIKLMLSSRLEMQKVIEQARSQCNSVQPMPTPPTSTPKIKDHSRSPERSSKSKSSPDRRRDKERSPRDRDRDKNRKSSSVSSRKDKSRSRSPVRKNRDRDRDRESDRRSKRDDRRKSEDSQKPKNDSSKHDASSDTRLSSVNQPQAVPTGNGDASSRLSSGTEPSFATSFPQLQQQPSIDPWVNKIWGDGRPGIMGGTNPDLFRPNVQQDFMARDPFGRGGDSMNSLNSFQRPDDEMDRQRFGLPPAFESVGNLRRQDPYGDNGVAFSKLTSENSVDTFRPYDSDQRLSLSVAQLAGIAPRPGFEEPVYPSPSRGLGFCIEVRGLPYSVSYKDIRDLFRGVFITNDGLKLINDENGQRTGTAVLRLTSQRDVNEALKRHRQYVGDNYIDVFRCTDNVFDQAIDSYLPPGMKKPVFIPPRPDDLVVFMKGLPFSCKEDEIINFFDGLRILDLNIELDFTGRPTGCGYVEFGTKEDFHAAMSMNRRTIGHRYIELSVSSKDNMMASRSDKSAFDSPTVLSTKERDFKASNKDLLPIPQSETRASFCVGLQGLPFNVTDREIADFFSIIGVPLAIHIMLNQDRLPTGEAFVEFSTVQQLEIALKQSGKFIGQHMVKVFAIPYDEMMELLGSPLGRTDPLLNRPIGESRTKGLLTADKDLMNRPMINSVSNPRSGMRDLDDSSNTRLGMNDSRNFNSGIRDSLPSRPYPGDSPDSMPLRGFQDGPGFRGPQLDHEGGPPHRGFLGDSRNFGSRPLLDGMDRPRGYLGDNRERNVRMSGGRPTESDSFDDGVMRNRRLPEDIDKKGRRTDSPDSRSRGPVDRLSDDKGNSEREHSNKDTRGPEDGLDSGGPPDFGPGKEGRMFRGPMNQGGPGPHDRRRMMPPGGRPSPNAGIPDGFGKPGCVVGATNIPYRANVDEILAIFKDYGLTKDNIIRRFDHLGRVTGDARLAFQKLEDAKKAIAELNGKMIISRPISLFMA